MKSLAIAKILNIHYSFADTIRGASLESNHCKACHAASFNGDSSAIYLLVPKNSIVPYYE